MPVILPYRIEYATSEVRCNKCRKSIPRDTIQIGIMQQSKTDDCMKPEWYDMECFLQIRRPVSVDFIDGFVNLRYNHQLQIQSKLGVDVNANGITATAQPLSNEADTAYAAWMEKQMKFQSNDFFNIYDQLKRRNSVNFMATLKANNQFVPECYSEILNHLTDIICFGALAPCSVCKDGKFVLQGSVYRCTGYDSPWSSCINSVKEPRRVPVQLPEKFREILIDEPVVRTRILRDAIQFNDDDFELYTKQPLFNMEFFIVGATKLPRKDIEHKIQAMGGKMASRIHGYLAAVISNAEEVQIGEGMIREAFIQRIQVISDDFLNEVMDHDPIEVIARSDLSKWGKDPYERMPERKPAATQQSTTNDHPKANLFNSDPKTVLECEYGKIYTSDNTRYEVVLDFVDISSNKNTYFKMQLLDLSTQGGNSRYVLTESSGRTGTKFGNSKQSQSYPNLDQATAAFKKMYLEKTGNDFGAINFEKRAGMYNQVSIDNETLTKVCRNPQSGAPPTKLSKPLYELMQLLYGDGKVFKSTLVAYCFDLDSMPLGKLNKTQIQAAISLLVTISSLQCSENINQIIAASNQFYSMFPHSFGDRQRPPVINTYEMIQRNINMLQHLLQKEYRYEFLTSELNMEKNLLDLCYEHLQDSAEITMLNKASGMYAQICAYVQNTQLKTKQRYVAGFDIDEVFEVTRHEELMRYQQYENNFNRQLLFHGTRISNFVGILTNGLKISPPEAIFNGSIFGKGIYFSDSVSKSAAYCSLNSGFGLVLLCEVAAGIADVRLKQDISPLNPYCESVQALGNYYPHPLHIRSDGLKIPNGTLIKREQQTGITFNEFVVSDVSRVKIRYLVKLKFKN
ncbi:poly [ADP-ribose] polymerase-like [Sitodiplosis mosellana]|uniref:poly [ADP-ribose] polymerase-like n=1 Tax=Sitodiplosis mosellana TaxID=263140 RepID=UPI0024440364|nr:poly [ADP-ribose] polymerase-like [Sitodiplosis mosellana]